MILGTKYSKATDPGILINIYPNPSTYTFLARNHLFVGQEELQQTRPLSLWLHLYLPYLRQRHLLPVSKPPVQKLYQAQRAPMLLFTDNVVAKDGQGPQHVRVEHARLRALSIVSFSSVLLVNETL